MSFFLCCVILNDPLVFSCMYKSFNDHSVVHLGYTLFLSAPCAAVHRLFDNHKITLTDLKCQTCTTRDFIRTDHFTLPVFPTARRQQSQTFTLPNFQNGRLPQWMTSTILNKFPHCQTCTLPCILLHCHVHTARHPYCLTFMHYQIFTLPEFHTAAILSHSQCYTLPDFPQC